MNFKEHIGLRVSVTAKVTKITFTRHLNSKVLVLEDVFINGSYFRDHTWVKMTKRLSNLKVGDTLNATATVVEYSSKLGLKSFRNVIVL